MSADMSGQVVVVTGGASGIGESASRLFAARKATVVVADKDDARAAALADELSGQSISMDLTSKTP